MNQRVSTTTRPAGNSFGAGRDFAFDTGEAAWQRAERCRASSETTSEDGGGFG
jgi:hypothetical protein